VKPLEDEDGRCTAHDATACEVCCRAPEADFGASWLVANGLGALHPVVRTARRVAIGVIGGTVLATGCAMLVLPGPAILVIPIGLGILGFEFAFARRWLRRLRESVTLAPRSSRGGGTDSHDDRAS
jgi:hypothetical protein